MKNSIYLTVVLITISAHFCLAQQHDNIARYLNSLPKDLKLKETTPQKYRITTDYFNGDIYGNFMNKLRVMGEYTRGFSDGTVKWNNVTIANGNLRNEPFGESAVQAYMENLAYTPSDKMMEASAFASFPPNSFYAKNLVWDVMGLEGFAWLYFDSLRLNQVFSAKAMNGEIDLAGEGSFNNRDVQLKWTGISQMNKELCALIEFRTFDNPLSIETEQIKLKGRSHYWGTIWISLKDKQIEHALLYEDVVMDLKTGSQASGQLINTTRELIFEKLN